MKEKVLELISEQFNIPVEEIDEDTSFSDDLNADSIQLMELIMNIEDEFDVELNEEDIISIETIGDVIDYIDSL